MALVTSEARKRQNCRAALSNTQLNGNLNQLAPGLDPPSLHMLCVNQLGCPKIALVGQMVHLETQRQGKTPNISQLDSIPLEPPP